MMSEGHRIPCFWVSLRSKGWVHWAVGILRIGYKELGLLRVAFGVPKIPIEYTKHVFFTQRMPS
jgi:hypothetical protein